MSFSQEIKSGLAALSGGLRHDCCRRAEIYGILYASGVFSREKIKLVSTVEELADLAVKRLHDIFSVEGNLYVSERKSGDADERRSFKITVVQKKELERIFRSFRYDKSDSADEIKAELFKCQNCRATFLRGAFMASGTVNDPDKGYHLEVNFLRKPAADSMTEFLSGILPEPKRMTRKNEFVLYYKDSESIESFLAYIGATNAAFTIMNKKIERELRSDANRRANSELANITKTVSAAGDRIAAIKELKRRGILETMPDELKITAEIQLMNVEATLSQLALLHEPPITKSGVNHRLKKLMERAEKEK